MTTTYTAVVTNAFGCQRFDSLTVHVDTLQFVDLGARPDTTICYLGSAQLYVNSGPYVSYSWSPSGSLSATNVSNPIASPVANTSYVVTVENFNGCVGMDTVAVPVNLPPTFGISATNPVACYNVSDTLRATERSVA